jgi:predicted XRE-type DNA-binding protein
MIRGSGNVFRDFGHEQADVEQFKAILAAEIIKMLDREELSVRGRSRSHRHCRCRFSRIRNADLGRFTLDRLVSTINRLGSRIEIKVKVHRTSGGTRDSLILPWTCHSPKWRPTAESGR